MIEAVIKDIPLRFDSDPELFSPNGIDKGTLAMLSLTEFSSDDKVLDLGCGYGTVGILAAKKIGCENVVMCDISSTAVEFARKNAALNDVPDIDIRISNGFDNISDNDFSMILSNPPYHTDFSVAKHFIEEGYKRLKPFGKMIMVTKRLDWYKNKLISVFGGVKISEIDGYYIFISEKRPRSEKKPHKDKKNQMSSKLRRKIEREKRL